MLPSSKISDASGENSGVLKNLRRSGLEYIIYASFASFVQFRVILAHFRINGMGLSTQATA